MALISLALLGGFRARLDAGPALTLPTRKAQAMLAYLAMPLGQAHPRDKLAALLWGDRPEKFARKSLRQTLFIIRKALADQTSAWLHLDGGALALDPAAVDVDVSRFEHRLADGTPAALAEAVTLYQGDLLQGLAVEEPLFEEWLMLERERLREAALEGLARLLAHQRGAGSTEAALRTALRLAALDPLQEAVHRTVMRLYAQLGRRAAALSQYQRWVAVLQRELGVEPEAATQQLHQEILQQRRVPLVTAEPSPSVTQPRRPGLEPVRAAAFSTAPDGATLPDWLLAPTDTPLIGRETELGRLRDVCEAVRAGRGRLVAILGEAGVGKSRLVAELARESASLGCRVLFGRAWELERILPFAPWVAALRGGGIGRESQVIQALSPVWRAELARLFPEMVEPGDLSPPQRGDPRLLFEAVGELLARLTDRQPIVVVLEDLHWADEMSLRFLAFLGRRLSPWRFLLVPTARVEELGDAPTLRRALEDLAREPQVESLTLDRLSEADTLALVQAMSSRSPGATAAAVGLEAKVWALSRGNPFVVIETVRALRTAPLSDTTGDLAPLAPRVRELVRRSLERLGEAGRQVVDLAAVLGREFEFALLQRATGLTGAETATAIDEAVRRQVLRTTGERFDFGHEWIREVAASDISPARRRVLHRRIAEGLEAVYAADLDPQALALGLHYQAGEVWDRAAPYLSKAARIAVCRSAYREALALYEQALDAAERLTESPQRLAQAIDIRFGLADALSVLDRYDRVVDLVTEAEDLATRLGDRHRLARTMTLSCFGLLNIGRPVAAVDAGRRALALAGELADLALEVEASQRLGMAHLAVGDLASATDCLRRTVRLLGGVDADARLGEPRACWSRAMAWARLALMLAEAGAFEEALAYGRNAVRLARSTERPVRWIADETRLGTAYLLKGDVAEAIPLLEQALAEARGYGVLEWVPHVASRVAHAYALVGRLPEAVGLAEEVRGLAPGDTAIIRRLGEVYLSAGRLDAALDSGHRARAMARERQERGEEAKALRLLGVVAARHDPPDAVEAEGQYREALVLAERLGFRPEVAHCHLGLGRLLCQVGPSDHAREHLAAAGTLFREMSMWWWLGQLEAEAARAACG